MAGTLLVVIEAMKMEHQVVAPTAGTITEVRRQPGQPVAAGDVLVVETRVASIAAASSTRRTRILREGEVLARAATNWAYVDFRSGRPMRIPDEVKRLFEVEPDEPDQGREIE